ncbi:MAG: ABC transporter permease, partial [Mesorhizobium sp.]
MSEPTVASHAALEEVVDVREQTPLQKLFRAQSFWVAVALVVL